MKKLQLIALAAVFTVATLATTQVSAQHSIPDNIAYGAPTNGGMGGKIIKVTNLNADGPGSFKSAIDEDGPRIVVFEVGGIIDLNKGRININKPYITIAGQTAPSPGITIIRGGMDVKAHDVIMQHIRIRPGDAGMPKKSGWEPDALSTVGGNAYNVIIDHCSMTWAVDENLSASASGPRTGPDATSHKITFSDNIIAEGLFDASHTKGIHSMGSLIHDFVQDIAIVGNLYSCNNQRNAFFKAFTKAAFVNNVIYNPGNFAIQMFWSPVELKDLPFPPENGKVSIVGNVMYKGANTKKTMALVSRQGDVYMEDNAAYEVDGSNSPMTSGDIVMLKEKPSWPTGYTALPLKEVPDYVTLHAGARPKDRDAIDKRIIADFVNRKGKLINSQDEVGGYPQYKPTHRMLTVPKTDIDKWLAQYTAEVE